MKIREYPSLLLRTTPAPIQASSVLYMLINRHPNIPAGVLERGDRPVRPNISTGVRRGISTNTIRRRTNSSTPDGRRVRFIDLIPDGATEQEDAEMREELIEYLPAAVMDRAGTIWTADVRDGTMMAPTPIAGIKLRSWRQQLSSLLVPRKKVGKEPSLRSSLKAIVLCSWLNVLLVFLPLSWAFYLTRFDDTVVFVTTFLGIIPLANLLAFATDELTIRVGETLGGFISVSLGNVVETIVAMVALVKCELAVVQAALVGAILSDLLLVLGICYEYSSQGFKQSSATLNSCLLTLCVIGVIIPTVSYFALPYNYTQQTTLDNRVIGTRILRMSHGVAVILQFLYACGLLFQFWSHSYLFDERSELAESPRPTLRFPPKPKSKLFLLHTHTPERQQTQLPEVNHPAASNGVYAIVVTEDPDDAELEQDPEGGIQLSPMTPITSLTPPSPVAQLSSVTPESPVLPNSPLTFTASPASTILPQTNGSSGRLQAPETRAYHRLEELMVVHPQEAGESRPLISLWVCWILLVVITALVSVSAQFLVDSINGLTEKTPLSDEWVGLVLLPLVGNASAHVSEVFNGVSDTVEDKLDKSIAHAAGSSIQIALLWLPFIVLLGWMIDKPLTLLFDPFEAACLSYSVIVVKVVIAAGHSDWLKGMILICLYLIIAVALWFYPGIDPAGKLLECT
ncbi:hypothetical protein FRB94_013992 [Tulasnella sp. JGI-2019a]|nr:hypothetical protein FRB94_013992 [Tulasnella sp. JGI-2019a]